MKLLVLSTWWPYPLDNGSRVRAFHLIRDLARRHDVTLVSFGLAQGREVTAPLEAFCARVEVVPPVLVGAAGLGVRGLLSPTPRHFVQTDNRMMRARVAELATTHDAAVAMQIDVARYLAELRSLPRLFDEVEVTVPREQFSRAASLKAKARHGLTWWKFRGYVKSLVTSVERATVVSALEREALAAMGCDANRVDVVPNGVEVTPLPAPGPRARRIIYPGAVTFSANLDAVRFFVHEIFPLIRRDHPDVEFWVTGATDGVAIEDLRLPGVVFTGRLPSVDEAIIGSAAVVVPLRVGGGTRLKILQAMALGTPLVSTRKGAEGLDVDPGRHLLIADEPQPFAAAVHRLLTDQNLGGALRAEAWGLVRAKYDWGVVGAQLEASLLRAVEDRRAVSSVRSANVGLGPEK